MSIVSDDTPDGPHAAPSQHRSARPTGEDGAIAVIKSAGSRVAFVIFQGRRRPWGFGMTGMGQGGTMDPIHFFRATGISDCNVVLVRDTRSLCYRRGISASCGTLDAVVGHITQLLALTLPDVDRLFVVGTSSGGLPAIYCGHKLEAIATWSFGGRVCHAAAIAEIEAAMQSPTPPGEKRGMAHDGRAREDPSSASAPERLQRVSEAPERIIDQAMLRDLVALRKASPNASRLHMYFSPANAIDSGVAHAFEGQQGVTLHPVNDVAGASSHQVVRMLEHGGLLPGLFSEYRQYRQALYADPAMEKVLVCPVCGGQADDAIERLVVHGASYRQCPECTHVFVGWRPGQEAISNFYLSSADDRKH